MSTPLDDILEIYGKVRAWVAEDERRKAQLEEHYPPPVYLRVVRYRELFDGVPEDSVICIKRRAMSDPIWADDPYGCRVYLRAEQLHVLTEALDVYKIPYEVDSGR